MFPHLNIFIDSSILYKHQSLNTKDITTLKVLGNRHLIDLYIPWIVYKESTTRAISEIKEEMSKAISRISSLEGKGLYPKDTARLKEIIGELEKFSEAALESNGKLWEDFIYFSRATIWKLNSHHTGAVFESYFEGAAPFSSVKSRKDIPDAFIFNALKELASDDKITFICEDIQLRNSSASIPNVQVYASFRELFDSDEMKEVMSVYNEQSPLDIDAEDKLYGKIIKRKKVFERAVDRYFRHWLPGDISQFEIPESYYNVSVEKVSSFNVNIERRDLTIIDESVFNRLKVTAEVTLIFNFWDEDPHVNKKRVGPLDIKSWYQKFREDRTVIFEKTIYNDIDDFDRKILNITIDGFEDITVV